MNTQWENFKVRWAVDGMPKDKQRLAEAAFNAGVNSVQPVTKGFLEDLHHVLTFSPEDCTFGPAYGNYLETKRIVLRQVEEMLRAAQ